MKPDFDKVKLDFDKKTGEYTYTDEYGGVGRSTSERMAVALARMNRVPMKEPDDLTM